MHSSQSLTSRSRSSAGSGLIARPGSPVFHLPSSFSATPVRSGSSPSTGRKRRDHQKGGTLHLAGTLLVSTPFGARVPRAHTRFEVGPSSGSRGMPTLGHWASQLPAAHNRDLRSVECSFDGHTSHDPTAVRLLLPHRIQS